MKIIELKRRKDMTISPKMDAVYSQFNELIDELNTRGLPDSTVSVVNREIEEVNSTAKVGNSMRRLLLKKQAKIVRLIEKEHKIVPKNYYRNLWLTLGMSAFGIPIGTAIGASVGNMGLLAIGLPIGMAATHWNGFWDGSWGKNGQKSIARRTTIDYRTKKLACTY